MVISHTAVRQLVNSPGNLLLAGELYCMSVFTSLSSSLPHLTTASMPLSSLYSASVQTFISSSTNRSVQISVGNVKQEWDGRTFNVWINSCDCSWGTLRLKTGGNHLVFDSFMLTDMVLKCISWLTWSKALSPLQLFFSAENAWALPISWVFFFNVFV